jgi:hypothetical protein
METLLTSHSEVEIGSRNLQTLVLQKLTVDGQLEINELIQIQLCLPQARRLDAVLSPMTT